MKLKDKKVLVTGGAGFIGSHLSYHFLKEGSEVLILDNLFVGNKEFIPEGALFKKIDIRSENLADIINEFEPDVIVHLAAIHYIPYCNANPEETFDVNVMGTRNLLEAISEDVDILFASSAAVYPPTNGPLTEDLYGPIDIYGKTKLVGEDLVRMNCENAIIARLFNVYGPDDTNPHVIPEIIEQIKAGNLQIRLGNLTPKRDYIHIDDVCKAIITLLKSGNEGVYNVGSGIEYSVKEIIEIISEILNKEIKIIQDVKRIRKLEREHLLADIKKIEDEVGWYPKINIENGLRKIIKFINCPNEYIMAIK